jgi:hypothetical protein
MLKHAAATALVGVALAGMVSAQDGKPAAKPGTKNVTHELIVTADQVYTGTVSMKVEKGKVMGDMEITSPTQITGKLAGTAKGGVLTLDFPYHMTEQNCEGNVKMSITMPKAGPAKGTMEAEGCGRPSDQKLTGTVELKPVAAAKK